MELQICIEKESENPIYRQILEQITTLVQNGVLRAGDKLPPERELAAQIGIARGTIKKAYEELERNKVIEVIQGSGSFVSKGQDVIEEGRKEKAIKQIDELLTSLEAMKFTYREIGTFISIRLMEREKGLKKVRVAAIDCNPEALSIFKKQLSYISNLELTRFLLSDIKAFVKSEDILQEFDVILTTSTHFEELSGLIPRLKDKIIQSAVSPSQQTIIDLATIPAEACICILCKSSQFLNIIHNHLKNFTIDLKNICHVFEKDLEDLEETLGNCNILVVPPGFFIEKGGPCIDAVKRFREKGGRVVNFEYQIERGSMIYIEEQISNVLNKK